MTSQTTRTRLYLLVYKNFAVTSSWLVSLNIRSCHRGARLVTSYSQHGWVHHSEKQGSAYFRTNILNLKLSDCYAFTTKSLNRFVLYEFRVNYIYRLIFVAMTDIYAGGAPGNICFTLFIFNYIVGDQRQTAHRPYELQVGYLPFHPYTYF